MANPFDLVEDQRRRRANAGQAQTNGSPTMRQAQQFSQPAGGFFAPEAPTTQSSGAAALASRVVQNRRASAPSQQPAGMAGAAPPPPAPTYQTYFGAQAVPVAQPQAQPVQAPPAPTFATAADAPAIQRPAAQAPAAVPAGATAAPGGWFYPTPTETTGQTQPVGAPLQGAPNQWGNQANLDPTYLRQQVLDTFARRGGPAPTEEEISYWVNKALTPDIYSDNQVRVGWNPYWADRLITGSDSSDPRLAGSEGLIADPYAYGLNPIITNGQTPSWYDAARAAAITQGKTTTPMPGTAIPVPEVPVPTPTPAPLAAPPPSPGGNPLPFGPGTSADAMLPPGNAGLVAAESGVSGLGSAPWMDPNRLDPAGLMPQTGGLQPLPERVTNAPYTTTDAATEPGAPGPGWVRVGDGWVPPDHPLAASAGAGGGTAPTGNPGDSDLERARRILDEYLKMVDPNTAAMKEQQKETALAAEAAARERALQQAAATGTSNSGTLGVTQQDIADALSGTLTGAYRDIDQWGEQQSRQNRLTGAQALQNLGSAQSSSGLNWEQLRQQNAQFYASLEQQAAQSAAAMGLNWAQMAQQDRQFLLDLQLRKAMAEQNANQWFFNNLLGGV